jgi:hypothetical protein
MFWTIVGALLLVFVGLPMLGAVLAAFADLWDDCALLWFKVTHRRTARRLDQR